MLLRREEKRRVGRQFSRSGEEQCRGIWQIRKRNGAIRGHRSFIYWKRKEKKRREGHTGRCDEFDRAGDIGKY